jgi:hypothetical protein
MTKFNPDYVKLRRAFSMDGRANLDDDPWFGEDINSGRDELISNQT